MYIVYVSAGKKYSLIDFIACLCMSCGLIFFTLADSSVSPSFNLFGTLLAFKHDYGIFIKFPVFKPSQQDASVIRCWALLLHVGVLLISLALCSDALIGNVQEKVMKQYGGSNSEMVSFCQQYYDVYRISLFMASQ